MNPITIITAIALVLAGTIAGYITNKYAVRWLFKPVTLFGRQIFDVSILSTDDKQEAFINSLSECVEDKILTGEVLKKEIVNETMKAHLDEIIDHFISEALPESFKEIKVSEMSGFAESQSTLKDFVNNLLNKNTEPLLVYVLDAIKVSDYLTEEQIQASADNLYNSIKSALKDNLEIKDKLTSILTELFFSAMFNADGRTALGKLTSKLFSGNSGNPLADLATMNFPEKISSSLKKILTSAVSGAVTNKSAGEYIKSPERQSLADKLQQEIMKKYDEKIKDISNDGISALTRSLSKSERLKGSISDVIYEYLNKNLIELLGGKVKDTVKIALGRLDPDQLCSVAERLLKGELKYLSYFGGLIGFLVSIPALFLTLGSFSASGFAANPGLLVFNILLMGFIGVITNIIAIAMFFRPYKNIDFLAASKHTKAFSQGLILQNQKVFSHTLGEYIGTELLTADNIIKMLETHRESFIDKLSEKIMPAVSSYFADELNSRENAARLSAMIFNKLAESKENVSSFLSGELGKRTFRSLFDLDNPETNDKVMNFYLKFLNKERSRPEDDGSDSYDYKFIVYAITNLIKGSSSMTHGLWAMLRTYYNTELADKTIDSIISIPELSVSAKQTLSNICQNDAAFDEFRQAADMCISSIASGSEEFLSPEFRDSFSQRISISVYNSAISCVPSIMDDIHIDKVTEERVNSLEPEEIKQVVLSFAAPVFKKLYALGLIGCVFGINSYLSFVLFIGDSLFDKEPPKKTDN